MWGWLRYALTASPMIDLFASTQLTPARSREPPAAGTPAGPARCGSAGPSPTGTGTARCPYTAIGSFVTALAITLPPPPDRPPRLRPRPAHPVPTRTRAGPPGRPLPAPRERRRVRVPVPRHRLEPAGDLARRRGVLAVQGAPLEYPLDAHGHVRPRPAQGRVQGHHPEREQPAHERGRPVARPGRPAPGSCATAAGRPAA